VLCRSRLLQESWSTRNKRANWILLAPAAIFQDVHVFLSHQDKIAHFGIFGVLTWLFRWSIPARWGSGWKRVCFICSLAAYGAAIEFVQPLIPGAGRSFEWMDMFWDCVGVAAGVFVCEWLSCAECVVEPYQSKRKVVPK